MFPFFYFSKVTWQSLRSLTLDFPSRNAGHRSPQGCTWIRGNASSMLSLVPGIGMVFSKRFLSLEKSPWFFIAPGHLPPPTCFLCPGGHPTYIKKWESTGRPCSGGPRPQEGGGVWVVCQALPPWFIVFCLLENIAAQGCPRSLPLFRDRFMKREKRKWATFPIF